MGQQSDRPTVHLLAKPEVLLSVFFTVTFCIIPLHVARCTYLAFHESFGLFFFFLGICFPSSKSYILSCNVATLAHLELGDFLEISLLSFVRVIAVLFFQNSDTKSILFCICCRVSDGIDLWCFVLIQILATTSTQLRLQIWSCKWRIFHQFMSLGDTRQAPGFSEEMWIMLLSLLFGKALTCLFLPP